MQPFFPGLPVFPPDEFSSVQTEVNARQDNEDLQTSHNHSDHLHDEGCAAGGGAGQADGESHGTQRGGKLEHRFRQTTSGGERQGQRARDEQQQITADKAKRIRAQRFVNFGFALCFGVT